VLVGWRVVGARVVVGALVVVVVTGGTVVGSRVVVGARAVDGSGGGTSGGGGMGGPWVTGLPLSSCTLVMVQGIGPLRGALAPAGADASASWVCPAETRLTVTTSWPSEPNWTCTWYVCTVLSLLRIRTVAVSWALGPERSTKQLPTT